MHEDAITIAWLMALCLYGPLNDREGFLKSCLAEEVKILLMQP